MSKTSLIIKHEFLAMINRKGFIVLTVLVPLVALLGIVAGKVIPDLVKSTTPTAETIGYVDQVGIFTESATQGTISLVAFNTADEAKAALLKKDVLEYIIITPNYLSTGLIQRYNLKNEIAMGPATQNVLNDFLLNNLLRGNNPDVIARVKSPMNVVSTTLTGTGDVSTRQGGFAALILPYIFSLLLMMSIFNASGYLLQGLGEEKENRVIEILLSSVSSSQLLIGKVIGLGTAGLVQISVWLVSANFLIKMASSSFGNVLGVLNVSPEFIILGIIYFVLGYLFMAVIMSGIGAITPTARDGQQMSVLITLPVVVPIYFMTLIMEHPENIVVKILTFIPVTAPITVIVRLGLSEIPIWELSLSIGILIGSIVGCFILASKLFRTYLLMYGKRPDFREIMRSFRSA